MSDSLYPRASFREIAIDCGGRGTFRLVSHRDYFLLIYAGNSLKDDLPLFWS